MNTVVKKDLVVSLWILSLTPYLHSQEHVKTNNSTDYISRRASRELKGIDSAVLTNGEKSQPGYEKTKRAEILVLRWKKR